jgi:hypothetical protein
MHNRTHKLLRFSLRGLLISLTAVALFVGINASRFRQNNLAISQLRARGVGLGCTYYNPIGPDVVYTGRFCSIPNDYLPRWFERSLCTEYFNFAAFDGMEVLPSDMDSLTHIPLLGNHIIFERCTFADGTLQRMRERCSFDHLSFQSTELHTDDCEQLARMQSLKSTCVDSDCISLEDLRKLRAARPDMTVNVYRREEGDVRVEVLESP